jgi:predicted phosphodiesterase
MKGKNHVTIMCLSDVKTFQDSEIFLREIKPDYVFMLGDILYDGWNQSYSLNKGDVDNLGIKDGTYKVVNGLKEDTFIISGNTHSSKVLEKIHIEYLRKFLKECIKLEIKRIYIVTGNHDAEVNYFEKVINGNIPVSRVKFIQEYSEEIIKKIRIAILPYNSIGKRKSDAFISKVCQSDIVMTHGDLNQLRYLVHELYRPNSKNTIISGHSGYGYFPPKKLVQDIVPDKNTIFGRKVFSTDGPTLYPEFYSNKNIHLVRIDGFPDSFLTLEISNKSINGKLLQSKIPSGNHLDSKTCGQRVVSSYTDHISLLDEFKLI